MASLLSYHVKGHKCKTWGIACCVRIGDVKIKKAGTNKMFAEVEIGRYGKVKKSRIVPLIDSLPYFKAWLAQHPMSNNPQAHLFISYEHSARYRNTPLRVSSLRGTYLDFRYKHFPKLLLEERTDVPPEDKTKIKQSSCESPSTHIYVDIHHYLRRLV